MSSHPQDYISLFPLDDMQPSKLMRLLSSNEEDANILSSPGEGWAAAPFPAPGLRLCCARPQRRHLCWQSEGGRSLSHFVSWLLFPTPRETGAAVPPARWRPSCPVQAQGTGLSLPRPFLPTSYQGSPLPGHSLCC